MSALQNTIAGLKARTRGGRAPDGRSARAQATTNRFYQAKITQYEAQLAELSSKSELWQREQADKAEKAQEKTDLEESRRQAWAHIQGGAPITGREPWFPKVDAQTLDMMVNRFRDDKRAEEFHTDSEERKDEAARLKQEAEDGAWEGYRKLGEAMLQEFPAGTAPTSFRFASNGRRLPAALLRRQVDGMASRLAEVHREEFVRERDEWRERFARDQALEREGSIDARAKASRDAGYVRWLADRRDRARTEVRRVRERAAIELGYVPDPKYHPGIVARFAPMEQDALDRLREIDDEYQRAVQAQPSAATTPAQGARVFATADEARQAYLAERDRRGLAPGSPEAQELQAEFKARVRGGTPAAPGAAAPGDDARARARAEYDALPDAEKGPASARRIAEKHGVPVGAGGTPAAGAASGYPSWLLETPAARAAWDALTPEAKERQIQARGR